MNRLFVLTPFPLDRESIVLEIDSDFIQANCNRFVFDLTGAYGNQVAYIDLDEDDEFICDMEDNEVPTFWGYPKLSAETGLWENTAF